MYIKKWTEFEQAAIDLYNKSPGKVRYCVKFKKEKGQLILRLTDDTTCIAYKTFSSIILNRFETLNIRLLTQIANLPSKPTQPQPQSLPSEIPPIRVTSGEEDDPMTGVTGVDPSRTTASASARSGTPGVGSGRGTPVLDTLDKKSGGGKKKKKGKR